MIDLHWTSQAFAQLQALRAAGASNGLIVRLATAPEALLLQPMQGQRLKGYAKPEVRRLRIDGYVLDYTVQRKMVAVVNVGLDPEASR